MDNGLIFPYPCVCDHGESAILTALKRVVAYFVGCCVWMRGT
jgi:hypothetical protein